MEVIMVFFAFLNLCIFVFLVSLALRFVAAVERIAARVSDLTELLEHQKHPA